MELVHSSYIPMASHQELLEEGVVMRVGVYNPLARQRDHRVRLPVQGGSYRVQGEQGQEVAVELVPLPSEVLWLYST